MNTFRQKGYPLGTSWPKRGEPGLYVAYLGLFESAGDFLWEKLSTIHCLHVIQRGTGVFAVDGKRYEARANSVFVFHPGMHVTYYDSSKSPWHYAWLHFAGRDAEWAFQTVGLDRENPYRDISGNTPFLRALDTFSDAVQQDRCTALAPVAAAWQLLDALGTSCSRTVTETQGLAEACRLVLENQLERTPSVEDLAMRFGVNRSTLFRAFKEQFHVSPKEYIDILRFEKACGLLQGTNQPIKQIAVACGFQAQDYFSTAFRNRYGASPSAWRNRERGKA